MHSSKIPEHQVSHVDTDPTNSSSGVGPTGPKLSPQATPDIAPTHTQARPPPLDLASRRTAFQNKATELANQIKNLEWYEKIPLLNNAKPELEHLKTLHLEAAKHVNTDEEAVLADALINLPAKNRPASIKKALEMTQQGSKILEDLSNNKVVIPSKDGAAALQWAFYNKAVQQLEAQSQYLSGLTNKPVEREPLIGGMTVLDDGGKVAQYLQASSLQSYKRPSSHFKETRGEALGTDFPSTMPLPANKKTTLFGTIKGNGTYLKNEYHGYKALGDRLSHAVDFIRTNVLRMREPGRREKFIPEVLKKAYADLNGPKLNSPEQKAQLKARGLAYMLEQLPESDRKTFAAFAEKTGFNNIDMRKGEEIIIPTRELGISESQATQQKLSRDLQAIRLSKEIADKPVTPKAWQVFSERVLPLLGAAGGLAGGTFLASTLIQAVGIAALGPLAPIGLAVLAGVAIYGAAKLINKAAFRPKKPTELQAAISKTFGSGLKASPEFEKAFEKLKKLDPTLVTKVMNALRNPTAENILHADALPVAVAQMAADGKLDEKETAILKTLTSTLQDQYLVVNSQFRTDTQPMAFSDSRDKAFDRWRESQEKFATIQSNRTPNDPKKQATEALVAAAMGEGFNLMLTYGDNINPDMAMARGQSFNVDANGFRSLLAMQQGDRAAYRVNSLDLAGASGLKLDEQKQIMRMLKAIENAKEGTAEARKAAFDEAYKEYKAEKAIDGAFYMTDQSKDLLKQKLLDFAKERDESEAQIYEEVTGRKKMSAAAVQSAVDSVLGIKTKTSSEISTSKPSEKIDFSQRKMGEGQLVSAFSEEILKTEGLFRISPPKSVLEPLVQKLINGEEITIPADEPHLVSGAYKAFFRAMQDAGQPLLSAANFTELRGILDPTLSQTQRRAILKGILDNMPEQNRNRFTELLGIMGKVAENSTANKMISSNLATVMAPNLFPIETTTNMTELLKTGKLQEQILTQLINDELLKPSV